MTSGAARLLDCDAASLLGQLPWQALPWLDDPAYGDKYRTALLSREPVSFHALRPPGTWLDFYLFLIPTESASASSRPRSPTGHRPWRRSDPDGHWAGRGEPPRTG
ncbi:hypothetical protein LT493_11775 [Streptomyces tricolor]|nr:hypothetical protein [Streptomyces tricolor]